MEKKGEKEDLVNVGDDDELKGFKLQDEVTYKWTSRPKDGRLAYILTKIDRPDADGGVSQSTGRTYWPGAYPTTDEGSYYARI
jgi:hypothetical protein